MQCVITLRDCTHKRDEHLEFDSFLLYFPAMASACFKPSTPIAAGRTMNSVHLSHFLSQQFSGNFIKNFFFLLYKQQNFADLFFLEMEVCPERPKPQDSFFLPSSSPISHTHIYTTQTKEGPLIPLVRERVTEVSLPGPDCSQTLWWSSVSIHLTPCQHEVTEQTRRPPPLPPTLIHSYSNSPLVQQAWDAEHELG